MNIEQCLYIIAGGLSEAFWTFSGTSCLISYLVKGWGRVRNEDCFTDNFGPNRHDKCREPFFYEGKRLKGCQMDKPSPSSKNRICQQLEQEKGKSSMPTDGDSLMIKYQKGRKLTVCYNQEGRVHQKYLGTF